MGWRNCYDHDVDFRNEDGGCPVCKCVKEIADLNTLLDLAEAALKRCFDHRPCSDPDCCSTAIANEAARVNAGETLAALKAGRKMIEVK